MQNAVLVDGQACGEYLGGFRVSVRRDGHSLHLGDENSDEEPWGRSLSPEGGDHSDVGVVVSALTMRS